MCFCTDNSVRYALSLLCDLTFNLQELKEIRDANLKTFRDISVDETNILNWTGLIVPVSIIRIVG